MMMMPSHFISAETPVEGLAARRLNVPNSPLAYIGKFCKLWLRKTSFLAC